MNTEGKNWGEEILTVNGKNQNENSHPSAGSEDDSHRGHDHHGMGLVFKDMFFSEVGK